MSNAPYPYGKGCGALDIGTFAPALPNFWYHESDRTGPLQLQILNLAW